MLHLVSIVLHLDEYYDIYGLNRCQIANSHWLPEGGLELCSIFLIIAIASKTTNKATDIRVFCDMENEPKINNYTMLTKILLP